MQCKRVMAISQLSNLTKLNRLRMCESNSDLALLLGTSARSLTYIAYVLPDQAKYKEFLIKKKSGGSRVIHQPINSLMTFQKRLSIYLQSCYEDFIFEKKRRKNPAHGFLSDRNIHTNAIRHIKSEWVLNIDLQDFFGSINFGRIRGFLSSKNGLNLTLEVSTTIAQLVCFRGVLPQGAPTSPILSNFIAYSLDKTLIKLSSKHRLSYTRYADDLSFSSRVPRPPEEIFLLGSDERGVSPILENHIKDHGFKINDKKTRIQFKHQRQVVTGLVVNQKVGASREYKKTVRAMLHNYVTIQKINIVEGNQIKEYFGKDAVKRLSGYLSFLHWLNKSSGKSQISDVYKEFLIYQKFFVNKNPIILCEGETDVIYYKEALKHFIYKYPSLGKVEEDKVILNVSFYSYRNKETTKLLGLGGCPSLRNFLESIEKLSKKFRRKSNSHPVIILVDKDPEGNSVIMKYNSITSKLGDAYSKDRFNVKVLQIQSDAPVAVVEDLLPESIIKMTLGDRVFSAGDGTDNDVYYGKVTLAEEVFLKNKALWCVSPQPTHLV